MASVFAHALTGYTFFKLTGRSSILLLILGIFCTAIPDLDILAFNFGIPYEHPLGHRGFTHSIPFAVVFAVLIRTVFFFKAPLVSKESVFIILFLFICTASHGLIDAMTSGGRGVGFFIPFDNGRYFLPWRPIQVSPIGAERFFSEWGFRVLKSEAMYVGIPCLVIVLLAKLLHFKKR